MWLLQWAAFFGCWLLFTWSVEAPELIVGVVGAALAATGSSAVARQRLAVLPANPRWLAQGFRLLGYAFTGTWEILAVLFRQWVLRRPAKSLLRAVRYEACGDDDASAARRALAITFTTVAPNFVVLDIDRRHGLLLFHQLEESAVPTMTARLGARP